MNRSIIFCLLFVCCLSLSAMAQEGALGAVTQRVEDAALAYTAQYAELERYLVVVYGSDETQTFYSDFRYVFAYAKGKSKDEDQERVDIVRSRTYASGNESHRNLSQLIEKDHFWTRTGANAGDIFHRPVEERAGLIDPWDPYSMPIDYWLRPYYKDRDYREIVNFIMPAGEHFDAELTEDGKLVGRWRHGVSQLLGYNEVTFDPAMGNMPVQLTMRDLTGKHRDFNAENAKERTTTYQINKSEWFKHPTGLYLPKVVSCQLYDNEPAGWRLRMLWWLNDEVPEEVFTIEDVVKAHLNSSVVERLIRDRATEEKEKETTETEKEVK